ncbi:MAG: ankyrin repeat domain-containing protein [Candidatus Amoebophilus sp.]
MDENYLLEHYEFLRLKIKKEFDCTPLHMAVRTANLKVAKILIRASSDVNSTDDSSGYTPLHLAAYIGYVRPVKLLLEHGAEVNSRNNEYGITPLHSAARYGHLKVVKLLVDQGADINAKNVYDNTSLHYAAALDNLDNFQVAKLLIEKGADPYARNQEGKTPLELSTGKTYKALFDLLKEKSIGLDMKNVMADSLQLTDKKVQSKGIKIRL